MSKSGKTKEDIIEDAMEDYKMKNGGKPFPFKHCLEVLWTCTQFDVWQSDDDPVANNCPPDAAAAGDCCSSNCTDNN